MSLAVAEPTSSYLPAQWHVHLAATLDPFSIFRLVEAGLPSTGRRCLTLAVGASRVPAGMAARVGPAGTVVATDADVSLVRPHPRMTVLPHDPDRPPAGRFDLIWGRLALAGHRRRDRLLAGLAATVCAGGALVVEEWYGWTEHGVLGAATDRDRHLVQRQLTLLGERILPGVQVDTTWAARVPAAMAQAGLTGIDIRVDVPVWAAGSPGARVLAAQLHRYRRRLLAAGCSAGDLRHVTGLLTDPDSGLVVRGHPLFSVIGHRPRRGRAATGPPPRAAAMSPMTTPAMLFGDRQP